jgi:hypothetical protein
MSAVWQMVSRHAWCLATPLVSKSPPSHAACLQHPRSPLPLRIATAVVVTVDGVVEPPPQLTQVRSACPPRLLQPWLLQPQLEKVPIQAVSSTPPSSVQPVPSPSSPEATTPHLKGSGGGVTRSSCYVDRRGTTSSSSLLCPAWLRRHCSRRLHHLAVIPHQQHRRPCCCLRR